MSYNYETVPTLPTKFNKATTPYQIANEEIDLVNNSGSKTLDHDNLLAGSIEIYSGVNKTGTRIYTFTTVSPENLAWQTLLSVTAAYSKVYVYYKSYGDQVEAEDTNIIQDNVQKTIGDIITHRNDSTIHHAQYVHPSSHAASMIDQDATHRMVSDTEKTTWNDKASTTTATILADGLMSSTDKDKLNNIEAQANKYEHPISHPASMITIEDAGNKLDSEDVESALQELATAIVQGGYTHPATHPATMIVEDATHRFATDTEKGTWNGKASTAVATQVANGLMSAADKANLDSLQPYSHPSTHPATMVTLDTTGYNKNLTGATDTTQKLANAVDQLNLTTSDFTSDMNTLKNNSNRELANMEANLDLTGKALPYSSKFYDLFNGLNANSSGILDTKKTRMNQQRTAGATVIYVYDPTGFVVGQEVTLQDNVNSQNLIIQAINIGSKSLTFTTTLAYTFPIQTMVYRSNVLTDGGLMKIAPWTTYGYVTVASTQVTASNFSIASLQGAKSVRLSNFWIVNSAIDTGNRKIYFYLSKDNGLTWTALCTYSFSNATITPTQYAIASHKTRVYMMVHASEGYPIRSKDFEVTTMTGNPDLSNDIYNPNTWFMEESSSGYGAGCSLFIDGNGKQYAVVSTKSTYPNSYNILLMTRTGYTGGWDSNPTYITTTNTANQNNTNPDISVVGNGTQICIAYRYAKSDAATSFQIKVALYTSSAWTTYTAFTGSTSALGTPVVKKCGWSNTNDDFYVAFYDETNVKIYASQYTLESNYNSGFVYGYGLSFTDASSTYDILTYPQGSPRVVYDRIDGSYRQVKLKVVDCYYGGSSGENNLTTGTINLTNCHFAVDKGDNSRDDNTTGVMYKTPTDIRFVGANSSNLLTGYTETAMTTAKARYNITPSKITTKAISAWIQKERASTEGDFAITADLSIVDSAANEAYSSMTKTESLFATNLAEDEFHGSVGSVEEKVTMKINLSRANTTIDKGIIKVLGAID